MRQLNIVTKFLKHGNDHQQFARWAGLGALFVYPLWSVVYNFVLEGDCFDPLLHRLLICIPAAFTVVASFIKKIEPNLDKIVYFSIYMCTGHLFWLVFENGVHPAYQVGMLTLVAAISPYFQTVRSLSFYLLFLGALTSFGMSTYTTKDYWIFYAGLLSVGGMSFLGLQLRIKILDKLTESRTLTLSRNKDIESIIYSINQGIMPIIKCDDRFLIGGDFSPYLTNILASNSLQNQDPFEILFKKTTLNAENLATIKTILLSGFEDDEIQWEANTHMLPSETVLTINGKEFDLEIDWTPVLNHQTQTVDKILVIIRDVTELNVMKNQTKQRDLDLEILMKLSVVEPQDFVDFCKATDKIVHHSEELIKNSNESERKKRYAYAFRDLHTLKGLARNFDFQHISLACHEAEELLQELIKEEQGDETQDLGRFLARLDILKEVFERYKWVNLHLLRRDDSSNKIDAISIEKQVLKIREAINNFDEIDKELLLKHAGELESLYKTNLGALLKHEISSLESLAGSLGKQPPDFQLINDNYYVHDTYKEAIKSSFIHILRNSIDHGIEDSETRLKKGKAAKGLVSVAISNLTNGDFAISIADDGKGLSFNHVKEIGIKKGLISPEETDPQTIARLIFCSNFTTSRQVSEISGRGVGMDAINEELLRVGLKVDLVLGEMDSAGYIPFTIEIICPSDTLVPYYESCA